MNGCISTEFPHHNVRTFVIINKYVQYASRILILKQCLFLYMIHMHDPGKVDLIQRVPDMTSQGLSSSGNESTDFITYFPAFLTLPFPAWRRHMVCLF